MKITRILIFLCLAAVVPFAMGQKGCLQRGGTIYLPDEAREDIGAVDTGIEPTGEPGPGEGEVKVVEKEVVVEAVCEEPEVEEEARPEKEEKPRWECSTCVKNLPVELNPDLMTSLSVEQLANSTTLKDFFGNLGQMVVSNMESRAEIASLFDIRNDLKRVCMACGLGEAFGGLLKTTARDTMSSSVGDQGSESGESLPADEFAGQHLRVGSAAMSGLAPLDFCGEYILIFEGNLREDFSLCSYAQNLLEQRVNYMPSLALAIHWSILTPSWLFTVEPSLDGFSPPPQFRCNSTADTGGEESDLVGQGEMEPVATESGEVMEYLVIALYKERPLVMVRKGNLIALGTEGYIQAFMQLPAAPQDRCPHRWNQLPEEVLVKMDGPLGLLGILKSYPFLVPVDVVEHIFPGDFIGTAVIDVPSAKVHTAVMFFDKDNNEVSKGIRWDKLDSLVAEGLLSSLKGLNLLFDSTLQLDVGEGTLDTEAGTFKRDTFR